MAFLPKQHVPAGSFQIGKKESLLLEAYLGTCVWLSLYCPSSGVGGLIHLLLPEPPTPSSSVPNPEKYAATGVPLFINALLEAGAQREGLEACLAGGALVGPLSQQDLDLDIGGRCVEVTKTTLAAHGIQLNRSETGGFFTCRLSLDLTSGQSVIEPAGVARTTEPVDLHPPDADQIKQAMENLKPIPQVALKVMRLINENIADTDAIAEEIRKDQVITARTLQLANSAMFGAKKNITSLDHAVVYLGQELLIKLVITAAVQGFYEQTDVGYALCKGGLYHHALGCAQTAEALAQLSQMVDKSEAYTAGLLHDIGKVVLDQYVSLTYPLFYRKLTQDCENAIDIEQRLLGTNHAKIGFMLALQWDFPHALAQAVRHHHQPEQSGEHSKLATIVFLADLLMSRFNTGLELERLGTEALINHLAALGMDHENFVELVDAIPMAVFHITNESLAGACE